MIALEKKYTDKLAKISEEIQASALLAQYLEEEDEEYYNQLKDQFEPLIADLADEVAQADPLQLESFEEKLTDVQFEGLFLPRILGYSVLRGAINDDYKYIRPQEHFKTVLMAICNSANFDLVSQRIGQTVEVGFALSSDIWITNLINEINNKQVKVFLQGFKSPKFRDLRSRHTAYVKYKKQFVSFNFMTATKPLTSSDLKIEYRSIVNFLLFRATMGSESSKSVYKFIAGILEDPALGNSTEHLHVISIIGIFFDLKDAEKKLLAERFDSYNSGEDEELFFQALKEIQTHEPLVKDEDYARLGAVLLSSKSKEFKEFLQIVTQINQIGYINSDAIEIARSYYNGNKGLSIQNECLRNVIFSKFSTFMKVLSTKDFQDYFELNKTFTVYMNIFANEKFNQEIKAISMKYVRELLRIHTEKRSKDYQDIKKFVSSTFRDLGFLNDKEIKDLFKTKRKKTTA
jgi:hypothetical protein